MNSCTNETIFNHSNQEINNHMLFTYTCGEDGFHPYCVSFIPLVDLASISPYRISASLMMSLDSMITPLPCSE